MNKRVANVRINPAQQFKTTTAFWQIGIVCNQASNRLGFIVIRGCLNSFEQSQIEVISQLSPRKIGVINKTVEHIFSALNYLI